MSTLEAEVDTRDAKAFLKYFGDLAESCGDRTYGFKWMLPGNVDEDRRLIARWMLKVVTYDCRLESEPTLLWFRPVDEAPEWRYPSKIKGLAVHPAHTILCRGDLSLENVAMVVAHETRHLRNGYLRGLGDAYTEDLATDYGYVAASRWLGAKIHWLDGRSIWNLTAAKAGDLAIELDDDGEITEAWRRTDEPHCGQRRAWSANLFAAS